MMEIKIFYLLLSMLLTFIILYFINEDPRVIVKYPKLDDPISDIYVDDNDVCYRYHKTQVQCF